MERPYIKAWKQYLFEQESQESKPGEPAGPAGLPSSKDAAYQYYYAPDETEPYQGADFSMKFTEFPWGYEFYDLIGKRSIEWKNGMFTKAAKNVMKPRVETTWFASYPHGPYTGEYKILGYHHDAGVITDGVTGEKLYTLTPNLDATSVYKWLFAKGEGGSDPKKVIVGHLGIKKP
jgi:hypothetical protein